MTVFEFPGVRRRNRPKKDITEKEQSESTSSEKAPAAKRDQNPQQDPLKWFGVLVPQSLKHAQSSFKQGMLYNQESVIVACMYGFGFSFARGCSGLL